MLYALNPDTGNKEAAHWIECQCCGDRKRPKGYLCPCCMTPVIAKLGKVNVHHWAHQYKDCDAWGEGEGQWHLNWKKVVHPDACEVTKDKHRADIVGNNGTVIELQHSPISVADIQAREAYYDDMIWLVNVEDFKRNFKIRPKGDDYHTFRWKNPRKSWWEATKPIFLDFGGVIFEVKKIYPDLPTGGWGYWWTTERFIQAYMSDVLPETYSGPTREERNKERREVNAAFDTLNLEETNPPVVHPPKPPPPASLIAALDALVFD